MFEVFRPVQSAEVHRTSFSWAFSLMEKNECPGKRGRRWTCSPSVRSEVSWLIHIWGLGINTFALLVLFFSTFVKLWGKVVSVVSVHDKKFKPYKKTTLSKIKLPSPFIFLPKRQVLLIAILSLFAKMFYLSLKKKKKNTQIIYRPLYTFTF